MAGKVIPWRWPALAEIGLSADAKVERTRGIGGSDANIIMAGDPAAITNLWLCKRGEATPDDLSDVLPVIMGQWTEALNIAWYERRTGEAVTRRGDVVTHPEYPFMRCTLDGARASDGAIWEAKHVNAFAKVEEVRAKYLPQLHHNMLCTGSDRALLSVFIGTMKWELIEVELDELYAADLIEAERRFWHCVETGEPPFVSATMAAPPPDKMREVDMAGSNSWAAHAADWLKYKAAAKSFDDAAAGLKELVEVDVKLAFGHGVAVSRAKNGALTVKARA